MTLLQSLDDIPFSEKLLHADYWLMIKINREWQGTFFDSIALFIRDSYTWLPLYLFLLLFVTINFGKKGWWWVVTILATAGLCDFISSQIIKECVGRPRPCRDPLLAEHIRILAKYCGMNGSFTSSHATNHFAVAMFLFQTLRFSSRWWALAFIWAGAISYAQVYVGVHYPSDVVAGGLLGCIIGYGASKFFNKQIGLAKA
jgi:membrane-associated phospholipid phosphatase